jgi:Uma2 family endonuclease
MLRLLPRQVRLPDVTFVSWKQFPSRKIPKNPILRGHPDLAVEVLSKSNTRQEMKRTLKEYFKAGTQLVWIVDPPTKTVAVYNSPTTRRVVKLKDSLDGGDVLPGFKLPLSRIFRE